MLKNASELKKIADGDTRSNDSSWFGNAAKAVSNVVDTSLNVVNPSRAFNSSMDEWKKNSHNWNTTSYNLYKSALPQLSNIAYEDFAAAVKAYGDPKYHSIFYPKLDINGNHTVGDVFKNMQGNKYVKGRGAWAYNNINRINNLKAYGKSPISSMLFGDYDKMRSNMYMMDQYGKEGTAENKFLKGYITPEQYKSYQRWRPLMAIWMNIRGWLRSLFQGGNFNAMPISHPYQQTATAGA